MKKTVMINTARRVLSLLLCAFIMLGMLSLSSCNTSSETVGEGAADQKGDYIQVVRVIDDIKYGGKFTNDKIESVWVSPDAVPAGAITSIEDLRSKYAASMLMSGDYITPEKLLDKKPDDAVDEDEEIEEVLDYKKLGYVVLTDYELEETDTGYGALINRVIAENPGRTIYIPDGSYIIEQPIVIPADPEKSVSLRLSNQTILKADVKWEDRYMGIIRVGVGEENEEILSMDEIDTLNYRSISIIGGCIYGSGVASGITVEGSKDTYIYNVSLKSVVHGIHIDQGPNELGATWVNVDNVNITGSDARDSVGVYAEGTYNTFANMRIASVMYGTQCTETGERNIFRNLHPLIPPSLGNETIGFYDMSDGNNYDICYNDQGASGFVMHENTRSVYNGGFSYWWSANNGYHVGFRSIGKFNSLVISTKVSQNHDIETDAYLMLGEEGGQGVVLYPIKTTQTKTYDYMLEQHCPTPII